MRDTPQADLRAIGALITRSDIAQGQRVRMVCDGVAPAHGGAHLPAIEVIYSGATQSADDVIIATLERSSAPSGITVVSSDRAIVAAARRRGARTIESGAFLSRLLTAAAHRGIERFQPKPLPALPLGDAEVGYWLQEFGETITHTQRGPSSTPPKHQAEPRASASGTPTPKHAAPSRSRFGTGALPPNDAWISEARKMWPDLTIEDLMMEKWLNAPNPPRKGDKPR